MFKNVFKIIVFFIFGMVGGIFADQIFWPYFVERPLFYKYRLEQAPIYITEIKEIKVQENVALQLAIEKAEKVMAGVKTTTKTGKTLEGTGLILTSDGLIITLAELVPQDSNFSFFVDGKTPSFQILKRDLKENLALIKLEEKNLSTTGFADLGKIKLGERVFLVGIIFEKGAAQKTVNEGIVRGLTSETIKTNISEKPNIKGSPLFDIEGNILGLNTVDKEGKVLAIPVSKIRQFTGL